LPASLIPRATSAHVYVTARTSGSQLGIRDLIRTSTAWAVTRDSVVSTSAPTRGRGFGTSASAPPSEPGKGATHMTSKRLTTTLALALGLAGAACSNLLNEDPQGATTMDAC